MKAIRYRYFRRANGHPYDLTLPCDLDARRAASQASDVTRVEVVDTCRVVYRSAPEERAGLIPHKKIPLDYDMVEWFDRAKDQ